MQIVSKRVCYICLNLLNKNTVKHRRSEFGISSTTNRIWKSFHSTTNRGGKQELGKQTHKEERQQNDNDDEEEEQSPPHKSQFVPEIRNPFGYAREKNKSVYLEMVDVFLERSVHRRNHVEFIYAALKHMAEFGVERDLEVYKALINVMPKGKFIARNIFQVDFMHYPKQQQCIVDLLEQMEDLGVMPDYEMEAMLLNVFGRHGYPLRKYWRMMYWMPKFKKASPWLLPNPVPNDSLLLAKLAVERMCTVDVRSKVTVYDTKEVKEAIDSTWIVSGLSPEQTDLINEHPKDKPIYIEGPFMIWLRNKTLNYFTLRADPDLNLLQAFSQHTEDVDDVTNLKVPVFARPAIYSKAALKKMRSIHQQDDGTIFAICATGTSTKDSLLSWIRLLERNGNTALGQIPVLFRFRSNFPENSLQIAENTVRKEITSGANSAASTSAEADQSRS